MEDIVAQAQAIVTREQERLRLREVFRYVSAFQRGDFEAMGDVLERATQDPILAEMIWETALELAREADGANERMPREAPQEEGKDDVQ